MEIPVGGVAFFDSGVGGLTVLNDCQNHFENEKFYYYGDNRRAPYGNLSPALIRRYTQESFSFFEDLQVKAAVIACNTVTALCIEDLRARYSFPIIGTEPAILPAAKMGGEIFVLTTRATFESLRFRALCDSVCAIYTRARIKLYPCDGLAGEIERRGIKDGYDFTAHLPRGSPNAVVLGCTHYVYIKETVRDFYGCEVFDGNEGVARRLHEKLSALTTLKEEKVDKKIGRGEKNRDKRPPFQKKLGGIGKIDHYCEESTKNNPLCNNANKCSCVKKAESLIISGVSRENEFYFLGSGARKNKEFYEQMFVF